MRGDADQEKKASIAWRSPGCSQTNRFPAVALYERDAGREIAFSIRVLGVAGGLVERVSGFVGNELFPAFGLRIERS